MKTLAGSMVLVLTACGPLVASDGDTSTGGDASTSPTTTGVPPDPSTTFPGTSVGTTMTTTTTSVDVDTGILDTGEIGGDFIPVPDWPFGDECDIWEEDCPEGYKCMPWANDGGNAWNATRCSPIAPDAHAPGESCTVE